MNNVKVEHRVERVPKGYRGCGKDNVNTYHERHTLVHGAVTVHGTSLGDCVRLMDNRVFSYQR